MAIDKNNPVDRKEFAAMATKLGNATVGADATDVSTKFNTLLTNLRAAGIIV